MHEAFDAVVFGSSSPSSSNPTPSHQPTVYDPRQDEPICGVTVISSSPPSPICGVTVISSSLNPSFPLSPPTVAPFIFPTLIAARLLFPIPIPANKPGFSKPTAHDPLLFFFPASADNVHMKPSSRLRSSSLSRSLAFIFFVHDPAPGLADFQLLSLLSLPHLHPIGPHLHPIRRTSLGPISISSDKLAWAPSPFRLPLPHPHPRSLSSPNPQFCHPLPQTHSSVFLFPIPIPCLPQTHSSPRLFPISIPSPEPDPGRCGSSSPSLHCSSTSSPSTAAYDPRPSHPSICRCKLQTPSR